ncbi:hypothetical protein, partial [Pseudomonas sp. N2-11]|uniref:hypothetical protein n=1 Tax=Pseudomonas sp. N2-11 TaxID=2962038 RepID=UPI0020B691FA
VQRWTSSSESRRKTQNRVRDELTTTQTAGACAEKGKGKGRAPGAGVVDPILYIYTALMSNQAAQQMCSEHGRN